MNCNNTLQRFLKIEPDMIYLDDVKYFEKYFVIKFKNISYAISNGLSEKQPIFYTKRNTKYLRESDIKEFIETEKSFYIHIFETEQGVMCYAMNEKLRERNLKLAIEKNKKQKDDTNKFLNDIYGIL